MNLINYLIFLKQLRTIMTTKKTVIYSGKKNMRKSSSSTPNHMIPKTKRLVTKRMNLWILQTCSMSQEELIKLFSHLMEELVITVSLNFNLMLIQNFLMNQIIYILMQFTIIFPFLLLIWDNNKSNKKSRKINYQTAPLRKKGAEQQITELLWPLKTKRNKKLQNCFPPRKKKEAEQ